MSEKFGVKVDEIFDTMPDRFRPEAAQGVNAAFGYDIAGRGKWKLTVKDGAMKIARTDDLAGCVAVTKADPDTFVGVNIGKVDGMQAFTTGKLTVQGDLKALGTTTKMFKKFVPPKKELSIREYVLDMFGTLEKRFQPKAAEGLDITVGYDISGSEGGQWTAAIRNGTCQVTEGLAPRPTLKLSVKAKDWVELMLGKVDAMTLLSTGRAKFDGDLQIAMKLGQIFAKYTPPGEEVKEEQELLVLKKVISMDHRFATGPVMGRFLNALKKKKILANRCPKCKRLQLPPREICAECRVRVDEFVEVGPKGNVRMLEYVYYASPDPLTGNTRETPYGVAYILLDGCKGNEVFSHYVRPDQLDRIRIGWNERKGSIVRPVWADERTGSLHDIKYYELDE
ncbi:MAG: SCP2 sterol-binding domain-containing protein [bacterium]